MTLVRPPTLISSNSCGRGRQRLTSAAAWMIPSAESAARRTAREITNIAVEGGPGERGGGGAPRENDRLVPAGVQRADDRRTKIPGSTGNQHTHAERSLYAFRGCSSGSGPDPWCAPAVRSSASTTNSASPAVAGTPVSGAYASMLRVLGGDIGFFVTLILYGCSILYGLGLLLSYRWGFDIMGGGNPMAALSPAPLAKLLFGASGAVPVFQYGMWWTVLSAGWLHGGVLHLLFNMMAVRNLAPPTADIYGAPRMIIIYSMGSVGGFLLSSFAGLFNIPLFGALPHSGRVCAIFGLLGALMSLRPPVG